MGTGRASPGARRQHGKKSDSSTRKRRRLGKMARLRMVASEISRVQGRRVPVKKGK